MRWVASSMLSTLPEVIHLFVLFDDPVTLYSIMRWQDYDISMDSILFAGATQNSIKVAQVDSFAIFLRFLGG